MYLRILKFLIPSVLLFGTIAFFFFCRTLRNNDLRFLATEVTVPTDLTNLSLDFCGESVPAYQPEINARMQREIRTTVANKGTTQALLVREARYKDTIMHILRSHNIPEDFYYVAIAESGLSNLTSPRGARGFWQMMPAAAREYGLEISETVDERYDPIKSTEAACRYLHAAHRELHNWSLVAASYNMGTNGLQRKLSVQRVANYYDLNLSRETSRYVYRIVALKHVMQHPSQFGIRVKVEPRQKAVPCRTIEVMTSVEDLRAFAESNNVSYAAFKAMNPQLISDRLYVPEGKTYTIRIPLTDTFDAPELLDAATFHDMDA